MECIQIKALNPRFMGETLPVHVTVVIPTRNEEAAIVDTIRSVPNDGWCEKLDFLIIDGNSTDRTRELAESEGATVYLEERRGYGRAYRTGFAMAPGDIIVTMDADCTYPGEEVPGLVRKLIEDDLEWITCDRLRRAEKGSMSGLHGLGNWVLSTTARALYWYGIHDSQSGMWVFRKKILEDERIRPTNDGMPLSEEFKIRARRYLGRKKAIEISVPYRERVGDAEINTWGDGWKNLRFLFSMRLGLARSKTEWGP
tara:strand:- start:3059 stop:3826 length:768 start_codon:yes stop_codon:yes gene_type:complete